MYVMHVLSTMCSYFRQWQIQIFKLAGRGEDGGAQLGPNREEGAGCENNFCHPAGLIIIGLVCC